MLSDDLLKGAKAAAAHLGLTERQIWHLTEQGHLPCFRFGRSLFYKKSEIEAAFNKAASNG
jgi:predicted DNA-binding transcriptional regulator AlpA